MQVRITVNNVDATQNPYTTTAQITGTKITQVNNPPAYTNATFTAPSDGYFTIVKDNTGVYGLKSYLFDITKS